jgi:hypothetical protein
VLYYRGGIFVAITLMSVWQRYNKLLCYCPNKHSAWSCIFIS